MQTSPITYLWIKWWWNSISGHAKVYEFEEERSFRSKLMELLAQWWRDFRWKRWERWKQCNIAKQRHGEWWMKMKVVSQPVALGNSLWGFSQGVTWIPVSHLDVYIYHEEIRTFCELDRQVRQRRLHALAKMALHHENPERIWQVLASQWGPQRQTWLQLFQ